MEEKQFKLFREKSLEAVESPESLNDYLKVTSPRVWLILVAIIMLLIGCVLWGIFGRINTSISVAVTSTGGKCVCFAPYDAMQSVKVKDLYVTVNGQEYPLNMDAEAETFIISEDTNPYIRLAGGLNLGDVAIGIPVNAQLAEGVYQGSLLTESLRPISLLLQ